MCALIRLLDRLTAAVLGVRVRAHLRDEHVDDLRDEHVDRRIATYIHTYIHTYISTAIFS